MRHTVIFASAFATLVTASAFAADLPGKGITVQPIQSTISEETFQTLLVSRALEKLGYTVNKPSEVDYNVGYYLHRLWRCDVYRRELAAAA
ncbi:glycine betaine-binding periplasmic protein [Salmonella enterica]|nr:glycine betaine-binding periplasmic protein [Salmonella enterica]